MSAVDIKNLENAEFKEAFDYFDKDGSGSISSGICFTGKRIFPQTKCCCLQSYTFYPKLWRPTALKLLFQMNFFK